MSDQIYIVDDDIEHGRAVARLLGDEGHAAELFHDPRRFLDDYVPNGACCVLTDVKMPQMDGFELVSGLKARDSAAAVILMTGWPRASDAVDAVRQFEALDYLSKPIDRDRLVTAIEEGLRWSAGRRAAEARLNALTRRERQVFDLLVQGHTNKSIAAELGLSPKTVEDHRAAVMSKTHSGSVASLVKLARGLQAKGPDANGAAQPAAEAKPSGSSRPPVPAAMSGLASG